MVCLICDQPAAMRELPDGAREIDCPEHGTYRVSEAAWPRWTAVDRHERQAALGIAIRAGETFGDIVPMVVPLQMRDG